jgi:DNA-binding transcriptional MerR regulator
MSSSRAQLPEKLYFRIGEVASLVGVEPHVLRYWEREFRTIRPSKSAKGQRVYSRRDVENLLRVRDLLYREGFTIAGAKKKLLRPGEIEAEPETAAKREEAPAPQPERTEARAESPGENAGSERVRGQLLELRAEVEAFLRELGGS